MKCAEVQQIIPEYLDQQMSGLKMDPALFDSLQLHVGQCDSCAEKLHEEQQFRQTLCQLNIHNPVPAPSDGFIDRALQTAVARNHNNHFDQHHDNNRHSQHSHRQGFIKGFGSALVAGLALWAVVGLFPMEKSTLSQSPRPQELSSDTISVSLLESTNINLAFHSLKEVQGATISISLSDNLQLVGYQNQQKLAWKTNLVAGDNVLTLPIKALQARQGKIVAQISHNNLHKSIELILDVRKHPDASKPGISNNYNITNITTSAA